MYKFIMKLFLFYLRLATSDAVIGFVLLFMPIIFFVMFLSNYPLQAILMAIGFVFLYKKVSEGAYKEDLAKRNVEFDKLKKTYNADFKGGYSYPVGLYFDKEKKLFCFYDEEKHKSLRVEPFDFVRKWLLTWQDVSHNNKLSQNNVQIELSTSDINTPTIYLKLDSKAKGDELDSVLSILLEQT